MLLLLAPWLPKQDPGRARQALHEFDSPNLRSGGRYVLLCSQFSSGIAAAMAKEMEVQETSTSAMMMNAMGGGGMKGEGNKDISEERRSDS